MRFTLIFSLLVFFFTLNAQQKKPAANHFYYSPKVLGDLGYFGSVDETAAFFDFKQSDRIADIGGGNGEYSCILSLIFDNVHFTVEDVDKKKLSKKKLDRNVSKFSKLRKSLQNCTFDYVIGTLMATSLKDSSYDVLFLKSSFHEIGFVEEMVADIDKKLKRGGRIIMMDAFSTNENSVYCKEGHRGYKIPEAALIMEHHGFYLTGMRSPGSGVPNYSNTLIFERDTEKSKAFITGINGTTGIENQIKRLSKSALANDSVAVKSLCDSIKIMVTPLQRNYGCFESWLLGFGILHFENKNYAGAKNVFDLVKELYPQSYQAYYWLGEVTFTEKRYASAYCYYATSYDLSMNPDSEKRMMDAYNKLQPEQQLQYGKKNH
jgi:hypothetical protein